jgi:hypothetical protein
MGFSLMARNPIRATLLTLSVHKYFHLTLFRLRAICCNSQKTCASYFVIGLGLQLVLGKLFALIKFAHTQRAFALSSSASPTPNHCNWTATNEQVGRNAIAAFCSDPARSSFVSRLDRLPGTSRYVSVIWLLLPLSKVLKSQLCKRCNW